MCTVKFDDNTVKQFIQSSLDVLGEYGYFTQCLWHVDDIHLLCEQRGWPKLSHDEARAVFSIFAELYDGDQGMTWSKLEQAVQVYLAQQGKVNDMRRPRYMSAEAIEEMMDDDVPTPELSAGEPLQKIEECSEAD